MTLHGDAGDVGASKSGSDCEASSSTDMTSLSQSGGGGAVAGSANDGMYFGNGFKVDASIGTIVVDGGLGGELGGVSFLGGAEELGAAVSESRGRFCGAAFGGIVLCAESDFFAG